MVILDTNILIDHLRRPRTSVSWLRQLETKYGVKNLSISTITIQELFVGQSSAEPGPARTLQRTISQLKVSDHNTRIAERAGALIRENHRLTFADAAIAATALYHGAKLATLNQKDFAQIPDLELIDFSGQN